MRDPALAAFEDLAADHLGQPGAGRRRMFGRDCLTLDGHTVAFLDDDRLAVKLPPAPAAELLASGCAVVPRMGDRAMRRWVSVALPTGAGGADRWSSLLSDARAHVVVPGQ